MTQAPLGPNHISSGDQAIRLSLALATKPSLDPNSES